MDMSDVYFGLWLLLGFWKTLSLWFTLLDITPSSREKSRWCFKRRLTLKGSCPWGHGHLPTWGVLSLLFPLPLPLLELSLQLDCFGAQTQPPTSSLLHLCICTLSSSMKVKHFFHLTFKPDYSVLLISTSCLEVHAQRNKCQETLYFLLLKFWSVWKKNRILPTGKKK